MPGKSRLKFFACVNQPMFPIDYSNVVMDTLHLYLRISDQLIRKLILELKTQDNIIKNSKTNDKQQQNLAKFELFITGIGIKWTCFTDKTGLLEYRDFTGPEHKTIQSHINLKNLMPWHKKLSDIEKLWHDFPKLMEQMKQDLDVNGILKFQNEAKAWVKLYSTVYQKRDITYYMHVMVKHVAAVLTNHGSLNRLSQQSFEKLNDQITKSYFRGSNHKMSNLQALEQIIQKANRIVYLYPSCHRKSNTAHCTKCGNEGHYKPSCSVSQNVPLLLQKGALD